MDRLEYAVLSADTNGNTRFTVDALPWLSRGEATWLAATPFLAASEVGFLRMPAGHFSDWHPAPRKQFVMVLTGAMEVEAGDGEKRSFVPGSVLRVEDVEGTGHRTRVVGEQAVLLAWVPVP